MNRALVIEDAGEICELIKNSLKELSLDLSFVSTLEAAKAKLASEAYDLILVDLRLPDGDGLSLITYIRNRLEMRLVPIIVVSSSTEIESKVSALSLGADDFISKPIERLEFRARVESKLNRGHWERQSGDVIQFGPLRLDSARQTVFNQITGEKVNLSNTEFRILSMLIRRQDWIFSRQQILDVIWGRDVNVRDRTVDTHIYSLRKKLGAWGQHIESVQGVGYRMAELKPRGQLTFE